jgi:hypothetical protein
MISPEPVFVLILVSILVAEPVSGTKGLLCEHDSRDEVMPNVPEVVAFRALLFI